MTSQVGRGPVRLVLARVGVKGLTNGTHRRYSDILSGFQRFSDRNKFLTKRKCSYERQWNGTTIRITLWSVVYSPANSELYRIRKS